MSVRFFTRSAVAAAGLFLVASCGGSSSPADNNNLMAANDFESVIGWMADPGTVTREQAHSGHYSVKVDGAHEFGMGYNLPLGKATMRKPHIIRIAGWAYMADAKSEASMHFQLFDPATGKETFGDGINYSDQVKTPRKWVEISKDIVVPESASSSQEMRVFLWRAGATSPAYVDDIRISLIE